ncbi:MAG: hypothetical protein HRT44_04590, partial [Bdellovibrionales bacterium]|nr:hypothetical protein [Bdellovibrionales bacterium]NQZ18521.1 hypothetical protein [Bdellovibrionales bacterium]
MMTKSGDVSLQATLSALLSFLFFAIFAIACSSQNERSRIVIDFDSELLDSSKKTPALKIVNAHNNGGPNWGLVDPVAIEDINCFGIFVYADEAGMNESTCSTVAGGTVQFGPRAGFFALPGNGEISVSPGADRRIILVGMRSGDLTCETTFGDNPEIDSSNYSYPFLLGAVKTDIQAGDNKIEIPISAQFTDVRKIKDCDFFSDGGNSTTLSLNHFSSKRSIWID